MVLCVCTSLTGGESFCVVCHTIIFKRCGYVTQAGTSYPVTNECYAFIILITLFDVQPSVHMTLRLATELKSLKNQHEAFFFLSTQALRLSVPQHSASAFLPEKKAIWTQAQSKAGLTSNTLNLKSKQREYNLHVVYKIYKCFMK